MVVAGFLVAGAGYLFGGGLAWLFRMKVPQIKAISIETAFQNGGIAFVILKLSLPAPYGDLATVAPVAQLVITGAPLWILLAIWKIYSRFFRKTTQPELSSESSEVSPVRLGKEAEAETHYSALTSVDSEEAKQTDIL